jgi:hypothetical protein
MTTAKVDSMVFTFYLFSLMLSDLGGVVHQLDVAARDGLVHNCHSGITITVCLEVRDLNRFMHLRGSGDQ